ncbi:hypothetical protein Hanom_Chr15g01399611 [Helianthus anomalus]
MKMTFQWVWLLISSVSSPHSNPEVAGSSLARSQCPYGSGFTPRLRLAGWRSARWDHLGGWEDRGIPPPPHLRFRGTDKEEGKSSFQ